MAYSFIQDVPADEHIYQQIRARLGDAPPKGMIAHIAIKHDGGLRYVDVWDTKDDWERYRDQTVEPTVTEVLAGYGVPHDHSVVTFTEVDVVDTWVA